MSCVWVSRLLFWVSGGLPQHADFGKLNNTGLADVAAAVLPASCRARDALMQLFGVGAGAGSSRRRYSTIIVLDEIDMLMTKDQAVSSSSSSSSTDVRGLWYPRLQQIRSVSAWVLTVG